MPRITAAEAGDVRLTSFLDLIAWSEGTRQSPVTKNDGYDVIVNSVNGPEIFTDYTRHPFAARPAVMVRRVPLLFSSASGRYQMIRGTWDRLQLALGLPDFSPESQDRAALKLLHETKADILILAGDFFGAIHAVSHIWASFPGNDYGQGGKSAAAEVTELETIEATEGA